MVKYGYCPTLQLEKFIDIEYIKSPYITEKTQYLKGSFICDYTFRTAVIAMLTNGLYINLRQVNSNQVD